MSLASPRRLVLALLLALAGCTVDPATGEQSFAAFMSPDEERRVGAEEHGKILREFGAYDDARVAAYVRDIGQRLGRVSDRPDTPFSFTVLDSGMVNAFALPGGYVYVTRGLLALADSEAELAAVMAHEIGHVAARHAAQRYSQAVVASIGATVLGALLGEGAGELAEVGGALYLSSYSRDQEYEADVLGVRYLGRTDWDARAMASFLDHLEGYGALEQRLAGRTGDGFSLLATHPRTGDRVLAAIDAAGGARGGRTDAAEYLRRIDGLLYGDSPRQGYVRGSVFLHPQLGFRFEVPDGFRIVNQKEAVIARGPGGAAILFEAAPRAFAGAMTGYLRRDWAAGVALFDLEAIEVNGLEGATAWTRLDAGGGQLDARLVAIRLDRDRIYRFVFLTRPAATAGMSRALRETTYSFRRLDAAEAAAIRPLRVRIATVAPGDTAERLAQRMAVAEARLELFRALNGLGPQEQPAAGSLVKIVID